MVNQAVNIHALPNVDISTTLSNGIVCAGEVFTLCAPSNASNPTFHWTGPNGFAATSLCISPNAPGPTHDAIYQVTVTDNYGCMGSDEATVTIEEIGLEVSISGSSIHATATGGAGPYTYTLSPGGQSNSTGLFQNLQSATYTVSATNQHNCGDSKTVMVVGTVEPAIEWGLSISPNPSNGLFDITSMNAPDSPLQFILYAGNGGRLREFTLEGATKALDWTDLPAGLYLLRVSDGKKIGALRVAIVK